MISTYLVSRFSLQLLKFTYARVQANNCSLTRGVDFNDTADNQLYREFVHACQAFKATYHILQKSPPNFNELNIYFIPSHVPTDIHIIIEKTEITQQNVRYI